MNQHKKHHMLSLIISCSIHLAILLILNIKFTSPTLKLPEKKELNPISMVVNETIIKKERPTPTVKKENKKLTTTNKAPQKTTLPGDNPNSIVIKKKLPTYPKDAINIGLEGTVKIEAIINTKGIISSIKIIKSSGHELLDQSFVTTVKTNYKFKPKRVMGVNKIDKIILSHTFQL